MFWDILVRFYCQCYDEQIYFFNSSCTSHSLSFLGMFYENENEVAQLCPTLCNPMDCSLPGSSNHGIFQARVLEWVAISFSIFPTQGSNLGLLHCRQTLLPSKPPGSPMACFIVFICGGFILIFGKTNTIM